MARAAMDIIERERAAADAKTARLKAVRLARDAELEETRLMSVVVWR